MVQLTAVADLDGFNRVLACLEAFLSDLVREALALGRSDRSLVEALGRDIEMAAQGEKTVRLMNWQYEYEKRNPVSPLLDPPVPAGFVWTKSSEMAVCSGRPRSVDGEPLLVLLSRCTVAHIRSTAVTPSLVSTDGGDRAQSTLDGLTDAAGMMRKPGDTVEAPMQTRGRMPRSPWPNTA